VDNHVVRARRAWIRDDGLTLIELLVAILLLGIIFSGAAAAFINLSRASVSNERRVQATALMTELHEEFQALPWDDAAVYEGELADLDEVGDLQLAALEWESMPLATLQAGCDLTLPDCRIDSVPKTRESVPVDGRSYEVFRAITWSPRVLGSDETIKRLTTVVRWEVLGRTLETRLESERAGLSEELGIDPTQTPAFDPLPSSVQLDENGRNDQTFRLDAIFPNEMLSGLGTVRAALKTYGDVELVVPLQQSVLNPGIFRKEFTLGELRIDPDELDQTVQLAELRYVSGGITQTMDTPITFVPWDDTAPVDDFTGTVTSVVALPVTVIVGTRGAGTTTEFCDDFTLTANVDGVRATDYVIARFNPSGSADERLTSISSTLYRHTWKTKEASPWKPPPGPTGITDTFRVSVVSGVSSKESTPVDQTITIKRTAKANGKC
jgi:prepilin-type N-terminal cleavage/methylation domain-containing protein